MPLQHRFNNDFVHNEHVRQRAHDKLIWSQTMGFFLQDMTTEELEKASEPLPKLDAEEENKNEVERAEESAALQALERIKQVRPWSEIHDNYDNEDRVQALQEHREKMARYRKRKDWEAWVEEDELDIEGERLVAEIKNYKSEHFW